MMILALSGCVPTGTPPMGDLPESELFKSLADPWCAAVGADEVLLIDIGAQLAEVEAAYEDTGLLNTEIARGGSRTVRDHLERVLPILSQDSSDLVTRKRWVMTVMNQ